VTVIKLRGQRKRPQHICTDSDGGLVTIYYDLSGQLMIPGGVINISFSPPPPEYPPVSFLRGLC